MSTSPDRYYFGYGRMPPDPEWPISDADPASTPTAPGWPIATAAKKAKYLKAFTLYVGGDEVYTRAKAEPLRPTCGLWLAAASSPSWPSTTRTWPTIRRCRRNTFSSRAS